MASRNLYSINLARWCSRSSHPFAKDCIHWLHVTTLTWHFIVSISATSVLKKWGSFLLMSPALVKTNLCLYLLGLCSHISPTKLSWLRSWHCQACRRCTTWNWDYHCHSTRNQPQSNYQSNLSGASTKVRHCYSLSLTHTSSSLTSRSNWNSQLCSKIIHWIKRYIFKILQSKQ